jgi:hypothetical protein
MEDGCELLGVSTWELMEGEDFRGVGGRLGGYLKEKTGRNLIWIFGKSWVITDGRLLYFYCKHIHIYIHDHNIYLDINLFPTPKISISQLLICPHRSPHSFLLVPLPSSLVRVPACRAGRTIALILQDHLPCPWPKNSVQRLLKLR